MAINGPLTNQWLVTLSLAKKMAKLKEENTTPKCKKIAKIQKDSSLAIFEKVLGFF